MGLALVAFTLLASGVVRAGGYDVIDIAPPTASRGVVVTGMNASGTVVGWYRPIDAVTPDDPSDDPTRGFLWSKSVGFKELGTLGGAASLASGINDAGRIFGSATGPDEVGRAAYWDVGTDLSGLTAGELVAIPLGGATPGLGSGTTAINASGRIVGAVEVEPGVFRACRWSPETNSFTAIPMPSSLPSVPAPASSQAVAINAAGLVIGHFGNTLFGPSVGFVWDPARTEIDPSQGLTLIPGAAEGTHVRLHAMSDSATPRIVGETFTSPESSLAFIWEGGVQVPFDPAASRTYFYGAGFLSPIMAGLGGSLLNAAGSVIGNSTSSAGSTLHAAIWRGAGDLTPLADLNGTSSIATAIAGGSDVVVGGATIAGDTELHAVRWEANGTVTDLWAGRCGSGSFATNVTQSTALGVNDAGVVMGFYALPGLPEGANGRAFVFVDGELRDLTPPQAATGMPLKINQAGHIVGAWLNADATYAGAFFAMPLAAGETPSGAAAPKVGDEVVPVAVCRDITIYGAAGATPITAAQVDGGSVVGCGALSVSPDVLPGPGVYQVTLSATNGDGVTRTCIATVTVTSTPPITDPTTPIAVCTNIGVVGASSGATTILVSDVALGSVAGQGAVTISQSTFPTYGVYTVTVIATNGDGLIDTCEATVTIIDPASVTDVPPVAVCKDISIIESSGGTTWITPAFFGNKSVVGRGSLTLSRYSFSAPGTYDVAVIATNGNGLTDTCIARVRIVAPADAVFDVFDIGVGQPEVVALNDAGQIAGRAYDGVSDVAFFWDEGVVTSLDVAALNFERMQDTPVTSSFAYGVEVRGMNASGTIIGSVYGSGDLAGGESFRSAFLWRPLTGEVNAGLGSLGGASNPNDDTDALAINDAGDIVGDSNVGSGAQHAFLWRNGVMIDLTPLPLDGESTAYAINNQGWIIGARSTDSDGAMGVVWRPFPGPGDTLKQYDLGLMNLPVAIDGQGRITGYATTDGTEATAHPVVWAYDALQDAFVATAIAGAGGIGTGISINGSGRVLGADAFYASLVRDDIVGLFTFQDGEIERFWKRCDLHPRMAGDILGGIRLINDAGSVAGSYLDPTDPTAWRDGAFVHASGVLFDLTPPDGVGCDGLGINGPGHVVGEYERPHDEWWGTSTERRAFIARLPPPDTTLEGAPSTVLHNDSAPKIVCKDASITLDANGQGVIAASDVVESSTCNIVSVTVEPSSISAPGAHSVLVTGTDGSGVEHQCTATVYAFAAGARYEIIDLGIGAAYPRALNDAGEIAGDAGGAVFFWKEGRSPTFLYPHQLGAFFHANAKGLNDAGTIVGNGSTGAGMSAFLWTPATGALVVGLGSIAEEGFSGAEYTEPEAISDAGAVVGTSTFNDQVRHAFVWRTGTGMVDLGSLGGMSEATAINESGWIIGTSNDLDVAEPHTNGRTHGVAWIPDPGVAWSANPDHPWIQVTGHRMIDLGANVFVFAIHADGRIVGAEVDQSSAQPSIRSYIYTVDPATGVVIRTPVPGPGEIVAAMGINPSGRIVALGSLPGLPFGYFHPYLTQGGVVDRFWNRCDLFVSASERVFVSDGGAVAGTYRDGAVERMGAFVYAGGLLQDVTPDGAQSPQAMGMNAAGQVFGGYQRRDDNGHTENRAFTARPLTVATAGTLSKAIPNDPEPPSITCVGGSVVLDASGRGTLVASAIVAASCNVTSIQFSPGVTEIALTCADLGTQLVEVTALGLNGAAATCVATIQVVRDTYEVVAVDTGTLVQPDLAGEPVAFNDDGLLVVNREDGTAFVWQVGTPPTAIEPPTGTPAPVTVIAKGIDSLGRVVGSWETTPGTKRAFVWDAIGGMRAVGPAIAGESSEAIGINAAGQIVGYSTSAGIDHAFFVWADGTSLDLLAPSAAHGSFTFQPLGLSEDGRVFGNATDPNSSESQVWYWKSPETAPPPMDASLRLADIGSPGSYASTTFDGMNALGQIVGEYYAPSGERRTFFWDPALPTSVDVGAASQFSFVRPGDRFNDLGQVLGRNYEPDTSKMSSFLWQGGVNFPPPPIGGTFIPLQDLGGALGAEALGINNLGDVVGVAESENSYFAVRWFDAAQEPVPLAVGSPAFATRIDDAGTVYGLYASSLLAFQNGNVTAFAYRDGARFDLTVAGAVASYPALYTTRGQVLGVWLTAGGAARVFVATPRLPPSIISGPTSIDLVAADDACGAIATFSVAGSCGVTPMQTAGLASGDLFPVGATEVSFTATDGTGWTSQHSFTVTVVDATAPVITLNGAAAITLEAAVDAYIEHGAVAADACGGTFPASVGGDAVDATTPDVYVVTYDAVDLSGNAATQLARTVTVSDTLPPVITLNPVDGRSDVTLECHGAAYVDAGASAIDARDGGVPVDVSGAAEVDVDTPGVYTVTYGAVDSKGNAAPRATRTITVVDTTPPVITLNGPAVTAVSCAGPAYVEQGAAASDACDGGVQVVIGGTVDSGLPGTYTLTYDATDAAGNPAARLTRTVTVEAAGARTITFADPTLSVVECHGGAPLDLGASVAGGCGGDPTVTISGAVNADAPGTYPIVYAASGVTPITRVITVVDTTPPALSGVPASLSAPCDAIPAAPQVTALDACAGSLATTLSETLSNGGATLTRVWTATDASGNSASATQVITLTDTTGPVITGVGASATIECPATPDFGAPAASDACGTATITYVDVTTAGTGTLKLTATRTWTATDGNGNASTASRTILVMDRTPPTLALPASVTVECGGSTLPSATGVATAADACDGAVITAYSDSVDGNTITRTWTAFDASGNSTSGAQTITSAGSGGEATITLIGAPSMTLECHGAPFADPGATVSGGCGGAPSFTIMGAGAVDVNLPGTYTVTYATGDLSITRSVTVVDTTAPVITSAPADLTVIARDCHRCPVSGCGHDDGDDDDDRGNGCGSSRNRCRGGGSCDDDDRCDRGRGCSHGQNRGWSYGSGRGWSPSGHGGSSCSRGGSGGSHGGCAWGADCPGQGAIVAEVPDLRSQIVAADGCGSAFVTQSPAPGATVGLGTHAITFVVTDDAGNATSRTVTLRVLGGLTVEILEPLERNGAHEFTVGRTIPVKARLRDCSGEDVSYALRNSVVVTIDVDVLASLTATQGTELTETYNGVGDPGSRLEWRGSHFQYNLSTNATYPTNTRAGPSYVRLRVSAAYTSAPLIEVGRKDVRLESGPQGGSGCP